MSFQLLDKTLQFIYNKDCVSFLTNKLLPTKTSVGSIILRLLSSSEGLLEISFASTLDALLKRLTNDNSFKYTQTRWTPTGMA